MKRGNSFTVKIALPLDIDQLQSATYTFVQGKYSKVYSYGDSAVSYSQGYMSIAVSAIDSFDFKADRPIIIIQRIVKVDEQEVQLPVLRFKLNDTLFSKQQIQMFKGSEEE